MTGAHVWAMFLSLALYAILGIAFWGWGEAVAFGMGLRNSATRHRPITFSIWLGWACVLLSFHLLHFVFPLNFYSVTAVLILGLVFTLVFLSRVRVQLAMGLSRSSWAILGVVIPAMLLWFGWMASRAMLSPTNYDSGLYHFSAMRWINSFPVVPGLGNLHGRLAFNQSFLTYAAALNFYPFFGHGRSIANSSLFVFAVLTTVELLWPFIRRPVLAARLSPLLWGPALFSLPILAYWALSSDGWASPAPDTTSKLLQIVGFMIFARVVGSLLDDGLFLTHDVMVLTALVATAITVKLSNLAFGAVLMGLITLGALRVPKGRVRVIITIALLPFLVLLVWCLRGYLLSGAPLYPSTFGYIRTQWAVPIEQIIEEANWVYSWARQPWTHWSNVLGNWGWFDSWWQRLVKDFVSFIFPLIAFFVAMVTNLVIFLASKFPKPKRPFEEWAIITLPIIVSLIFWFFTAPDPRFANASFMLLPVTSVVLLLNLIQNRMNRKVFMVIVCAVFIISNLQLLWFAYLNRWTLLDVSTSGFQPVRQVALEEKVTECGLHLFLPVSGDQCWDARLPCTPHFKKALCLREPPDMAAGFWVRNGGSTTP